MKKWTLQFAMSALLLAGVSGGAWGQQGFKSPEDAVRALGRAVTEGDDSVKELFGPMSEKLLEPDSETRKESRRLLQLLLKEGWALASLPEGRKLIRLGKEGWPFPVTLVKKSGNWQFDSEAGVEEVLNRRIGRNELIAVESCLCLVRAEDEYRRQDRDGDGVREYTSRLISSPGQQDGLYWEAKAGQEPSPLQVALKHAWHYAEGRTKGTPWFGYHFRLLEGQGDQAPGGARGYQVNGNQLTGWAVVAYPAHYGSTGVMSFLCNQDGTVFEKDLGSETAAKAESMTLFNPDSGWQKVPHQDLPK